VYSAPLLDHFEHPRNVGAIAEADAAVQMENPACGDVLKLTAKIADGTVSEIRFQAKGCTPSIACGSAVTEIVRGKSLAQASAVSREDVMREVGGVPPASTHAAQLAVDALRALLAQVNGNR
jgi:nitrogen fixation NifU-like protein